MIVVFLYGQPEDTRFQPNSRATKPMGFLFLAVVIPHSWSPKSHMESFEDTYNVISQDLA